jgi:peptidoglycan/LPS O-acetylase OafA/YrhL
MSSPAPLDHFNTIRGLAALAVMSGHLRALTFLDAAKVTLSPPLKVFYFLTGFGREAVMIFFVLSGFFISRSIIQAMESGKWTWRDYVVNRLSRLWLVLIPALVFTWVVDVLGVRWSDANGIYNPAVSHGVNVFNSVLNHGWTTFFGNMAFLQTIYVPYFGSNDPLWSLANEFWYYMLFPLMATLCFGLFSRSRKIASAALAVVLMATFLRPMLLLYVVWLMGTALFLASRRDWAMRLAAKKGFQIGMGFVFALVLVLSRTRLINDRTADFAVGLSATLFLLSVLGYGRRLHPLYRRAAQYLSDLSYPLYAIHLPLCIFVLGVVLHSVRRAPSPVVYAVYACTFLVLVGLGTLLHVAFQRHTDMVRKRIGSWFRPSSALTGEAQP